MKRRKRVYRQLFYCFLSILLLISFAHAYDTMSNPDWYIYMWDSGYSDLMICPQGHEQLSGEWAAAILYDNIAIGEAMWLEKVWVCPDWTSNSQFSVIQPFSAWDDPNNPIVGYNDTGQSVINNGDVEITIDCSMVDAYTIMGLSPAVVTPNRVTSYRYVMLQTYTIKNVKAEDITNISFFQMMHPQPNDDYEPNNYGVYDPTDYSDPSDDFPEFHFDMTFFAPYDSWSPFQDDVIGFSASKQPTSYEIGIFPGHVSEPGPGSLHHEVEADNLKGVNYLGPAEISGAMKWYLGTLKVGEEVSITVLFSTSHSDMGLPPEPVPEPTIINYTGDIQGCQGGQASLSALLIDPNNNPISGKVIKFLVGDQSAEAITDESGIAKTSLLLNQASGNYMVTVSFIGDSEYGGSLDSHPFEIMVCEGKLYIDIKPGSCPNPLNLKSKGVLPVAVLGTENFDITTIDPETILLSREGIKNSVAPISYDYEDVATPFEGELCDCHDLNGDGYLDLTLNFSTQELVETLELDKVSGETIPLTLTAHIKEEAGPPISAEDCIMILKPLEGDEK